MTSGRLFMKVTVGRKNKKFIWIYLVIMFLFFFPFFLLISVLPEIIGLYVGILFVVLLILLVLVIPGLSYMDMMWEVDENHFKYMSFSHLFDKTRLFYQQLFKKDSIHYDMSLKMKQIDFIQVTYYQYSFYPSKYLFNGSGYKIVLKLNMLDGSQYVFDNVIGQDREGFLKAIAFMKKQGIYFIDQNKILEAYQNKENMHEYSSCLDKRKQHD